MSLTPQRRGRFVIVGWGDTRKIQAALRRAGVLSWDDHLGMRTALSSIHIPGSGILYWIFTELTVDAPPDPAWIGVL